MPQMAPLSWMLLFFIFIMLYVINTMKIYFINTPSIKKETLTTLKLENKFNWKW